MMAKTRKPRLLYYEIMRYHDQALAKLHQHFEVAALPDPGHDTAALLAWAEVIMAPLGFPVDRQKMDCCPELKVIASSTLSVPHIDLDYAAARGLRVVHLGREQEFLKTITPTAELTWGLVLALTRHIPWASKAALAGQWGGRPWGRKTPRMLSNMSLGVVGLGRLGALVASYGQAFGMPVYYWSRNSRNDAYTRCSSLPELARAADIVSVHVHHTPETGGLIDRAFFQAMRPGSYFINTARGEVVDEEALLAALESGHLAGAALDVLAGEFQPDFPERLARSPLVAYARQHDNLIITPHYAGATQDAWSGTQVRTIELILASLPDN
ncbi:MAG: D-isomer specific 2-hydroxyacid dehydrogenase family protein [Thermodesulfobacteriota bacterium]